MQEVSRAVVIGSGICGASVAYHLAKLGWTDIVLLEQGELTSGTTSHAPGLVGQLRSNAALVKMLRDSVALYRTLRLEGEPGFYEVGSLRLASSRPRLNEIERQHAFASRIGLPTTMLSPDEALDLFPIMDTEDVLGALFVPSDGSARAPVLAGALLRDAQAMGVQTYSHVKVTGIQVDRGHVRSIETTDSAIKTEIVVVAAGIWSPTIGRMAGVSIPVQPMQHQVIWSDSDSALSLNRPVANMRDPDHLVYFRQDGLDLVMGGYELNPRPFDCSAIPDSDNPTKLEFDAEQFSPLLREAAIRVPGIQNMPIAKRLNGLESFTPDGEFILGEASEVGGFWTACGFCAHGVAGSGGVGKALANWIVNGESGLDLSPMDIRRFGGTRMNDAELRKGACRVYRDYYSKIAS